MPLLGPIIKEVVERRMTMFARRKRFSFHDQERVLKKLLERARYTSFGKKYHFGKILESSDMIRSFSENVPVYDYDSLYREWWYRTLNDEENVTWPGRVKYFALTSGTSQASSKKIPVTGHMIRAVRRVGLRHSFALTQMDLPAGFFEKRVLMLGGSMTLNREKKHLTGDLSGILTRTLPIWFHGYYKPGRSIGRETDWSRKLDRITREAAGWDIGIISGVPAWLQILMEKIIEYYGVNTIHDIWPNLRIFLHGGVSLKPYRSRLEKLFGKEVVYLETYLASEGFLATQSELHAPMKLVVDNGIFFEFIPFNDRNFYPDGNLKPNPEVLTLGEVEDGKEYAILISTCAGAWRYIIGDTVRIISARDFSITITGRIKHFLSLCGEHISVDNMSDAVEELSRQAGCHINEFTVVGMPYRNRFCHKWYIAMDEPRPAEQVKEWLDGNLKRLNDDYAVERGHALSEVFVHQLPHKAFYEWMKMKGKEGGQHKFPRVLSYDQHTEWENFLKSRGWLNPHHDMA
ncbi:MAG TPA: GH3 auxin-responsive promoter [Bacteroidetes bacterium]|nr:GH3 auxin-responsive promoter [Bacteroidota bacterium]